MTLSFNKLNEIAAIYESIADSEQEQLDESYLEELTAAQRNTKIKSELNAANAEVVRRGGVAGSISRGLTSMFGSQKDIDKNKASDKASDARVRQAGAASVGKYYSSSDGKTYANYNDAKAARDSRLKDLAAKQQASRGTGTGSNGSGSNGSGSNGSGGGSQGSKVVPTKPAGSAMDQWAKANPKLAAAKAERDRTRGTSATTNPLMKDTKANLPAPAPKSAPPSSTLKSATDAASKPSAFTPKTTAVASSTTDKGAVPATNAIAAAPKPKPMVPTRMPLAQSFEYDAYDLVLEYLLSQGHAETVAEAQYLMTEMDAEMIGDIVEVRMDPRGRPASGPMNVYANPKKPSKEHSDAVKAYDEKQKKKTPEQRKKELDDYRERQMNNK
jgi:hypothetical protein